jgi:hypothetical protein
MKNTDEFLDDFSEVFWERIRRDHEALEVFQASPLHLKAKSRLREILSHPPSRDSCSMEKKNREIFSGPPKSSCGPGTL